MAVADDGYRRFYDRSALEADEAVTFLADY